MLTASTLSCCCRQLSHLPTPPCLPDLLLLVACFPEPLILPRRRWSDTCHGRQQANHCVMNRRCRPPAGRPHVADLLLLATTPGVFARPSSSLAPGAASSAPTKTTTPRCPVGVLTTSTSQS